MNIKSRPLSLAVICATLLWMALLWFTLFAGSPAHAGGPGLRCGAQLIIEGFHISQVRALCGEPDAIERYHYDGVDRHSDILVVEYLYNFGPRKLMRLLRFENGRLVSIESLGYGYR